MKKNRYVAVGSALVCVATLWIAFTPTDRLMVNKGTCEFSGVGVLKSMAQGDRFRNAQVLIINDQMARIEEALEAGGEPPIKQQAALQKFDQVLAKADKQMQAIYAKVPEAEPLPEEKKADDLRAAADELEMQAAQKRMRAAISVEYAKLAACKQILFQ